MSRVKIANLLALTLFINACSQFEPFIDRRRDAGVRNLDKLYVGESLPDAPAVCYNNLWTDYGQIKKLADEECINNDTGRYAEPVKQTVFTCRLFVPNHFYFKCVK